MSEVYCPGQSNGIISQPLLENTRVTGMFCTLMRISLVVLRGLLSLGRGQIKSSFTPVCFWVTNIDEFKL